MKENNQGKEILKLIQDNRVVKKAAYIVLGINS